ncbi:YncE family protein [Erythrobacter litoralis]|uniref:YncE family protein n=1 Tax=Erythrobacter litoralis TaxID=39960 RepID=UPI002434E43B|nr:YncE family protein [Erythrobacter litoralis]MDG6078360.1 YncE family protein [Erythrobacter litoralis]
MVKASKAALLAAIGLAGCAPVATETRSAIEAESDEGALFVAGKFGNTLARVDLGSGQETARVDSCANPHELAVSPDSEYVALACYGGTSVDIFRTADLVRVASVDLGSGAAPHGIVWHRNGSIYSTAEGRNSVFMIRDPLSEMRETFEYGTGKEGSHMLAVSPDGRTAWTTDLKSKTVTRIDMLTKRAPFSTTVGIEPEGIALSEDGNTLWVTARGSDMAYALDPQSLEKIKDVPVGRFPLRIALRSQGDVAITSNLADGALSVIDTDTGAVIRTIAVSSPEEAESRQQVTIAWSPDGRRIYVAETGTDTIAEVDFEKGEVLRRFSAGDGGDGLAVVQ